MADEQLARIAGSSALSIRQPWATLLLAGIKTIEVRTWRARRRGLVLIHAGQLIDPRPEAWTSIETADLQAAATLRGGIVGVGNLVECREYRTAEAFAADSPWHRNDPGWFRPPRLFGLIFRDIRSVPFYPYPGQTMFFEVKGYPSESVPGQ